MPGSKSDILTHCASFNSYRFVTIIRSVRITELYESAITSLGNPECRSVLGRLRLALDDNLFVRTPTGMVPTPRAEKLATPIRKALDGLQMAFEGETFVPSTDERRFVIAINNYAAVVAVGPIVAACRAQAPKLRLAIRPSGTLDLADLLDRGELDLVISAKDAPAERFASVEIIQDPYVAVLRQGHPALSRKLTLLGLVELEHLTISSSGEDLSFLDNALAAVGGSRTISIGVPYLAAGSILVQSNLVAVLGRKLALEFRRAFPLEVRDLPFEAPRLRSVMMWHRRFDDSPAHRWLRNTVIATSAAI